MARIRSRLFLIPAVVASLALSAWPKERTIDSVWAAEPVRLDGLDQDWEGTAFLTDGGSKVQYALRNDGKNLYIIFQFKDPMSASTIEITGLRVFFTEEGKKSKDRGLHFVKKDITPDALIAYVEKTGEALTDARKAEIRQKKEYTLFEADVINAKNLPAPVSDPAVKSDPPAFSARSRPGVLIYEFRIPLSRTNQPGGLGVEPGQSVKLGFEWGGLTKQVMKNLMAEQASGGGMPRQGTDVEGAVSDTRSGEMQSGSDFYRDPRTKLHSFWVGVKLAAGGH